MKEKIKDWIRIIVSILIFNIIILAVLGYSNILNGYTLSLKILLDISIVFATDKTISYLNVGWKDGFTIKREIPTINIHSR